MYDVVGGMPLPERVRRSASCRVIDTIFVTAFARRLRVEGVLARFAVEYSTMRVSVVSSTGFGRHVRWRVVRGEVQPVCQERVFVFLGAPPCSSLYQP